MKQEIMDGSGKFPVVKIGENSMKEMEKKRRVYLSDGWVDSSEEEFNAQFEAIGDPDDIAPDEEVTETEDAKSVEEAGDAESVVADESEEDAMLESEEEEAPETDTEDEDIPPPLTSDDECLD